MPNINLIWINFHTKWWYLSCNDVQTLFNPLNALDLFMPFLMSLGLWHVSKHMIMTQIQFREYRGHKMCTIICHTCIESYLHRIVINRIVISTIYRQRHNTSIYKWNIYSGISLNTTGIFFKSSWQLHFYFGNSDDQIIRNYLQHLLTGSLYIILMRN